MMIPHTAIAPVHAIESATQAASQATSQTTSQATSQAGTATAAAVPQVTPATDEAATKFRTLMDNARLNVDAATSAHSSTSAHDSALSKIVEQQDGVVGDIQKDIEQFQKDAPTLSPTDFAARSVELQFKMAEMMTTIEMGVSYAQGGKGAVQNLMKNQ
ncbi:hypothetical protein [Paraburkholderia bannensis]|uniref:hypothetical protein n=1 Tax=Paraburkholderia bannensis TaxID=765414 RepID=UPI002AB64236|nr:hypothetical protein [Paraburkholderia bannensis]